MTSTLEQAVRTAGPDAVLSALSADAWDTFVHAAKLQSASSVKWFG